MQPKDELVLQWLARADDDVRLAELALSAQPPVYWAAAFHAQQAAEKALKALVTFRQVEYEKSHNIRYLLELCAAVEPGIDVLGEEPARLTRYAVESRYPLPQIGPTAAEAAAALEVARDVQRVVRDLLPDDFGRAETDM